MGNYVLNPRIDFYKGINIGITYSEDDPYPGVTLYKDIITPKSVKIYLLANNTWDKSHHTRVRKSIPAVQVEEVIKYINSNKDVYNNIIWSYYARDSKRFKEDAYYDNFGNYHIVKFSDDTSYLSLQYKSPFVFNGKVYDCVYEAMFDNKKYFKEHSIFELLELKFTNHELERNLLETGTGTIFIAYNLDRRAWHLKGFYDTGPNCLGQLLTKLRDVLRRDKICQI